MHGPIRIRFPYRVYRVDATGSSTAPIELHPRPQTISLRFVFILGLSKLRFRKFSLTWKLLHRYMENCEKCKSNTSLLLFHCAPTVHYNSICWRCSCTKSMRPLWKHSRLCSKGNICSREVNTIVQYVSCLHLAIPTILRNDSAWYQHFGYRYAI